MSAISIIVPVYNVEKYLERCIDSILAQTFTDFELILVDDGSTDGSGAICDQYALKDGRITVIHQANQGVSAARNCGLDAAQGEYIGFIDSDDYIEKEMYETILREIIQTSSDVGICQRLDIGIDGEVKGKQQDGTNVILNTRELVRKQFDMPATIGIQVTNKVYSKATIRGLRFRNDLQRGEDAFFLNEFFLKSSQGVFVRRSFYIYVNRSGSATTGGLNIENEVYAVNVLQWIANSIKSSLPEIYSYAYAFYIDSFIRTANGYKLINSTMSQERQEGQKRLVQKMRHQILKETFGICLCNYIGLKQKIAYFMWGLNIPLPKKKQVV